MAQHNFAQLQQQYPAVIGSMPDSFNAHEFILELARCHQTAYVEALHTYRHGNPFQTVHQQLATFLSDFPQLVRRDGDDLNSRDIWTQHNGCSRWRRV
jgi:hypothetical protein